MKLDMHKVVARMQDSVGLVHASLVDHVEITKDIHKVIVSFNTDKATPQARFLAIASMFENEASPIESSFREISGAYKPTACGFIVVNTESKPFTEEMASSGKYKTIAGNCLMDSEDESLWEVTSSGDNKYLVRKSNEDLSQLVSLASLKNQTPKYQKATLSASINPAFKHDYIAYVDKETASVKYGYVLSGLDDLADGEEQDLEVLDSESGDSVDVDPELVVESANLNGDDEDNLPNSETAAEYDSSNKESMKAYFKQMFSYSPEYYREIESIINSHAVV